MVNRRIIDQTEALSLSGDDYLVADNTNLGTRKIQFTRLLSGATPFPPDYITGFEIAKMGNTTISISSGYARSSDNLQNMQLSTSLIKDISATFDLGNNAGCMPSGLTLQANTKYYVFLIAKSGGETDIIIDTDINCSNGLSDNIVVLNNFNKFACVGSVKTDTNSQIFIINSYIENLPKNYKSTTVNWGSPDMTTGVSVAVGLFTPSYDGYLAYTISGQSGGGDFNLKDGNGNIIFNNHPDYSNKHGGLIRLSKGTTYEIATYRLGTAIFTFYKCNGEV
jgi:hypothetical protein